jgi:Uma2 family endonuclease
MKQTIDKPSDKRFIHTGVNWEKFKLIQAGFADLSGIRLFYYEGEVQILAVSLEHEAISRLIGILLGIYLAEKGIEFTPSGSFTQEKEGIASAQADESYFIGTVGTTPDISIEVVFTSGNERKLNRYQALGVKEVWFWEDGRFALYCLRCDSYEQVSQSEIIPNLDIELLSRCLLMTSRVEAVRAFRQGIN